jgi:hypothetical protein
VMLERFGGLGRCTLWTCSGTYRVPHSL